MTSKRLAVYSLTRDRLHDTRKSFALLSQMAGMPYDHYVFDNGSVDGTHAYLRELKEDGLIQWLHLSPDNKGQCIATNRLLDAIGSNGGYDYIMRWDNDITPKTDGFVSKLIEACEALSRDAMVSPDINGLKHKPKPFGNVEGEKYTYAMVEVLGGACRLTRADFFAKFRLSEHGPLALGEAQQISVHAHDELVPMAYVREIVIEHPTEQHETDNPDYFKRRRFEEFIPYGL